MKQVATRQIQARDARPGDRIKFSIEEDEIGWDVASVLCSSADETAIEVTLHGQSGVWLLRPSDSLCYRVEWEWQP